MNEDLYVCVCVRRAQQLLLVKIQKLVYRGGKEENSRVRDIPNYFLTLSFLFFFC